MRMACSSSELAASTSDPRARDEVMASMPAEARAFVAQAQAKEPKSEQASDEMQEAEIEDTADIDFTPVRSGRLRSSPAALQGGIQAFKPEVPGFIPGS
eukprot:scaffold258980_cov32-Prasinocladus_malaysianus.AAC.1